MMLGPDERPLNNDLDNLVSTSQRFRDPKIHSWYTSVMGFPDHIVDSILVFFAPDEGATFLDPHCGSGTALIQAQAIGLDCFGLDANPTSVLASRVKTDWTIDATEIIAKIKSFNQDADALESREDDPIFCYLQRSGMIERGWITADIAMRAAAIKRWIDATIQCGNVHRFFMLALIASIIRDVSNVKFGPELYCIPARDQTPDVAACFTSRLNTMVCDLETSGVPPVAGQVHLGDSRQEACLRGAANWNSAPAYVVTSPPYPTEHDYTRNARLELVFMESVSDADSLRRIKKRMIRSHSKGIYAHDVDADQVKDFEPVQRIRRDIEDRVPVKSSGFEGQYSKVVGNYFGGMLQHFRALANCLPSGSKLAYVVGDEASYKGVHIPTAQILAEIVDTRVSRVKVDRVAVWRSRRSKKEREPLYEHLILLSIP